MTSFSSISTLEKYYVWYCLCDDDVDDDDVACWSHRFLNIFGVCLLYALHFWWQQWWRHRLLSTWICMLSWLFILVCTIFFLVYSCEMFPILMEWKNTFRLQKYLGGLYMADCWCYYCGFPYHSTHSCISCSVFSTLTRTCFTLLLSAFIRLHGFSPKSLYTKNESQTLQKKQHQKWNNILPRNKAKIRMDMKTMTHSVSKKECKCKCSHYYQTLNKHILLNVKNSPHGGKWKEFVMWWIWNSTTVVEKRFCK